MVRAEIIRAEREARSEFKIFQLQSIPQNWTQNYFSFRVQTEGTKNTKDLKYHIGPKITFHLGCKQRGPKIRRIQSTILVPNLLSI